MSVTPTSGTVAVDAEQQERDCTLGGQKELKFSHSPPTPSTPRVPRTYTHFVLISAKKKKAQARAPGRYDALHG